MKKIIGIIALALVCSLSAMAQTTDNMDRIEVCKQNYRTLFGGEALTGQGTDPEMMDILQKFIFGEVFQTGDLTMKQREMITCITLATLQTLPQLKAHAGAALNVGVTPEELREVMYLTAPFIGFPKMLNAVATVNEVFKERGISLPLEKQGTVTEETRHKTGKAIQDKQYPGGVSSVMSGMPGDMGKDVEQFLTDYFFGEIYSRDALDLQTRELLGYCVLTTLEAESQLHSHYHGNINAGNSPETLTAAVIQCLPYIGFPAAIKALRIIKQEYAKEDSNMQTENKALVVYFSATGTTAKAARTIADVTGGTLYGIVPQQAYTSDDLDWNDRQSRSSVEMKNPQARPALKDTKLNVAASDVIFIGYPIWWDQAPRIINTFIESLDLKGKTLVPFATSGGSGISNSVRELRKAYPELKWMDGKLLNGASRSTIQNWVSDVIEKQ